MKLNRSAGGIFYQDQGFRRRAYLIGTFELKTDDHGEKSPGPKGWDWLVEWIAERLGRKRFATTRAALLAFGSASANRTASDLSGFTLAQLAVIQGLQDPGLIRLIFIRIFRNDLGSFGEEMAIVPAHLLAF